MSRVENAKQNYSTLWETKHIMFVNWSCIAYTRYST